MSGSSKKHSFCGVANPFALAEAVQGKKINWAKKPYPEKIMTLEKALGMPYHELFDPKLGSPLYRYDPAAVKKVKTIPSFGLGGPYVPPSDFQDFSAYKDRIASPNIQIPFDVRDAIQGSIPNCWLIAALASLAWTNKVSYTVSDQNYQFSFYGGVKPGSTSPLLPVDNNGSLLYCRSYTSSEIWPALYEKAYVQWRELTDTGQTSERPDYSQYCDTNNPLSALSQLLPNQTKSVNILHSPLKYPDLSLSDSRYLEIQNQTATVRFLPIYIRKMMKPAIAWTYDTRAISTDYKSILDVDSYPEYDTNTLPSSHCYSILGTYGMDSAAPDSKYIVLRNPYGPPAGDPNMSGILTGARFSNGIDLADNDGIFGISVQEFVKKFEGFGWAE